MSITFFVCMVDEQVWVWQQQRQQQQQVVVMPQWLI
jgi:hypothetical protein